MLDDNKDIRWQQRFSNYLKAFKQLEKFVAHEHLNEMEEQGLIKAFEYTYELGWKTLQDLLVEKGFSNIFGPKPVIEKSFNVGLISDGKAWLRMHKSSNLATHTYDEGTAQDIIIGIRKEYFALLKVLVKSLEQEITNGA